MRMHTVTPSKAVPCLFCKGMPWGIMHGICGEVVYGWGLKVVGLEVRARKSSQKGDRVPCKKRLSDGSRSCGYMSDVSWGPLPKWPAIVFFKSRDVALLLLPQPLSLLRWGVLDWTNSNRMWCPFSRSALSVWWRWVDGWEHDYISWFGMQHDKVTQDTLNRSSKCFKARSSSLQVYTLTSHNYTLFVWTLTGGGFLSDGETLRRLN